MAITENEQAFLNELTALTRKHGIAIGGCGCCGSPWLAALPVADLVGEYEIRGSGEQLAWNPKLIRHEGAKP